MSIREHLSKEDIQWADQVVEKMHHKLTAVRERSATKLPAETNDGVHDDRLTAKGSIGTARGFWTNGFWAGSIPPLRSFAHGAAARASTSAP